MDSPVVLLIYYGFKISTQDFKTIMTICEKAFTPITSIGWMPWIETSFYSLEDSDKTKFMSIRKSFGSLYLGRWMEIIELEGPLILWIGKLFKIFEKIF